MKFTQVLFIAAILFFSSLSVQAQSLFDGVRLAAPPMGVGVRAAGMGGAMTAAANDYTALEWNPAALAPLPAKEIGISIWSVGHNSNASFLNTSKSDDASNIALFSIGAAFPAPTKRGHLAFAVSYDRVQDYTATYSFSAINPGSSFLNTQGFVLDPGKGTQTFEQYKDYLNNNNQAWYLYLTRDFSDSSNPKLTTPFGGGLEQSGTITEEGSMSAFRVGGAIDVAENISVGMTINIYSGEYNYRRVYNEADINNVLPLKDTLAPNGFLRAQIVDVRRVSPAGISAKFGVLAKPADFVSVGFTIETPTSFGVDDAFTRTGTSQFRTSTHTTDSNTEFLRPIINNYSVSTPFKIGGGAAFNYSGATLSGDFTYYNASQLRFTNSVVPLDDLNDKAKAQLGSVFAWRVGGEYIIAPIGLSVRAGYGVTPSSYKDDPNSTKTLSGGLGIIIGQSMLAEISYQHQTYRTNHIIYNDITVEGNAASAIIDKDDIVRNVFTVGFSFRF